MIGRKLNIKRGKTKDIVKILKVSYTSIKDTYLLECESLCTGKLINLKMTSNEIKQQLI